MKTLALTVTRLVLLFGLWATGMLFGSYVTSPGEEGNYWWNICSLLAMAVTFASLLATGWYKKILD